MALINTTTTGILGTTVYGDGQGALTVQKDGVTQGVFGPTPAFSVYLSTTQTISSGVLTKVAYDTKSFDTNNCFDTTNNRFIPNVAGYYQLTARLESSNTGAYEVYTTFKKNGSEWARQFNLTATGFWGIPSTTLVYLNGTTDYVDFWWYQSSGSSKTLNSVSYLTYFQGVLVKAA